MISESPEPLALRLSQLEEELRTLKRERQTRRKLALVAVSAAGLMVTIGTAFAANGNCPNGMPFCFSPNQPAAASEVNQNFAQLKEWLEAKVGTAGAAVAVNTPAAFSAGVTTTTLTSTGAANLGSTLNVGSTLTVAGQVTANGGLTVAGTVFQTGYESSCFHMALAASAAPACCRINVRNGQVQCRRASAFNSTAWFASGPTDPFSASTLGAYSLSCFDGVSGENFPTCCRTDVVTGSVTCRSASDWALTMWRTPGTAF